VLDPSQKDLHIKRFWGRVKHADALKEAEKMVCTMMSFFITKMSHVGVQFRVRHIELYGEHGAPTSPKKKTGKVHVLLRELSSDEDSDDGELEESLLDPQSPWLKEFHLYLNSATSVPKSMSIIQWWGVSQSF
jgi:hypothetical protein